MAGRRRLLRPAAGGFGVGKSLIGLALSPLTLGTAQFGSAYGIVNDAGCPGDDELVRILQTSHQAGISYFDTAAAYGNAEERLGTLLPAEQRALWGKITKVPPLHDAAAEGPGALADAVEQCVDGARRRLGTTFIEVVMFHRFEDMFRLGGEALRALAAQVEKGAVGAIGASIYTPEEAVRFLAEPLVRHIQLPFNLLDWRWNDPSFTGALSRRPDAVIHVRSAFLQGLLLSPPQRWPAWVEGREELAQAIDRCVSELACRNRIDLCLSYNQSMPWVSTTVVGVDSLAQLESILGSASGRTFDEEEVAMIAKLAALAPPRLLNPATW